MALNRLGIGDIALPAPQTEQERDLKISLEDIISQMRDNVGYLLKPRIVTVTSDYTATDLDNTILGDASSAQVTVTLPDATTTEGLMLYIKKTDASNNVVIDGNGSQTIDGSTTHTLSSQNDSVQIQSNGTNWFIIAKQ